MNERQSGGERPPATLRDDRPGYFRIEDRVVDSGTWADISLAAAKVYVVLCRRADKHGVSFPHKERLAADAGVSLRAVYDAVMELERAGLVGIERATGRTHGNTYFLQPLQNDPDERRQPLPPLLQPLPTKGGNGCRSLKGSVKGDTLKGDTPKETPPKPPTGGRVEADYPADFRAFRDAYPPGRRNAPDAFRKWRLLDPDDEVFVAIMAGLEAWKASPEWQDGKIPGADRWLRLRKWTDPPAPAAGGRRAAASRDPRGPSGGLTVADLEATPGGLKR